MANSDGRKPTYEELEAENERLRKRVGELEAENERLRKRLSELEKKLEKAFRA